ncbi:MAG: glycosyltransferase, partial [Hyphomicrobiaceae bacterium]
MAKVVVLDPSCAAAHGHHLNSLIDLAAAVAPQPATFLVNAALPGNAFPVTTPVHRVFTTTVYDEPGIGPRPNGRFARRLWKLRRTLVNASTTSRRALANARASTSERASIRAQDFGWSSWRTKWPELESALALVAKTPVDHLVVPSADVELICGLATLRSQIPNLAHAQIHARLITLTPSIELLRASPDATPVYRALMAKRMDNVHLYVETPAMGEHIAATYGLSSDVYPYLLAPAPFVPKPFETKPFETKPFETKPFETKPRGPATVFGYFGGMRNEKGFDRLLPIIAKAATTRTPSDPPLAFIIHASDARGARADDLRQAFAALTGPLLKIDFIAGPLSGRDYQTRFDEIDVALLPYTGTRYALSGSGIVCEALSMGKAVITSTGLSFGGQLDETHSIAAPDDTAFAAAILSMARNIPRYRQASAARAQLYHAAAAANPLL